MVTSLPPTGQRHTSHRLLPAALVLLVHTCVGFAQVPSEEHAESQADYAAGIHASQPVAYWSFENGSLAPEIGHCTVSQEREIVFGSGPDPSQFPLFSAGSSLDLSDSNGYLRVADPGENSDFDFDVGDTLSIEAWVAPERLKNGAFSYIVGKGRTQRKGFPPNNQNWALRLKGVRGGAALTFLFRSRDQQRPKADVKEGSFHRWTSTRTFGVGDGWHYVALSYTFGEKNSLQGFIDGQPVDGKWDQGGATNRAPVVDNDEVWIGSSMNGNAGSSFHGLLDEIAIYRRRLSIEEVGTRYQYIQPTEPAADVPENQVLIQLFQGIPDAKRWYERPPKLLESFTTDTFAFAQLPSSYSERGILIDRPTPFLLRAHADIEIPRGKRRLLLRSRDAARLYLDGKLIGETPFYKITIEAHGPIWELDRSHSPNIRPLQRGDQQVVVELNGDGRTHRIRLDTIVGLNNRRPELGETSLSMGSEVGDLTVISFDQPFALTDAGWKEYMERERTRLLAINQQRRQQASQAEAAYWQFRHELAYDFVGQKRAHAPPKFNSIDQFIDAELQARGLKKTEPTDDLAFLRRVALDVVGTIPNRELITEFMSDTKETRRQKVIDRLLEDPGWADHWVSYWQDVLAENPNIINPSLNNTGPFRWWIYESLIDNKPVDRFVTELIRMEGSQHFGGPAGFALATENDVPMAAKAHVLGQAFLGVQMKCARCHDAPSHDVLQSDLFSLAAMLARKPVQVPGTSSINLPPEQLEEMAVEVTLKPGEEVKPRWAFDSIMSTTIPDGVVTQSGDSRERLAALMTLPQNNRFTKVVVNRLWKRYLGVGIVEPVHDWEATEPSHPQLLDWLADELVMSGYDLKHVTRLILNSSLYARRAADDRHKPDATWFTGPLQRKLTAEQLVDSLFVFVGKPYDAGQMSLDIDGVRPPTLSLNLGRPRRAWMFSATSNERDRPALDLPFARPFIAFLEQFGWRGARQGPVHQRPDDLTATQPAEFANGILVRRATRVSDDHAILPIALQIEMELDELIEELYLRLYTRRPTPAETKLIQRVLAAGFESRVQRDAAWNETPKDRRGTVSWSVHLENEATEIKMELQEIVRRGDLPTQKLDSEWRERLEDVIWGMLNSPEFRFAP